MTDHAVLIAAAGALPAMKARVSEEARELLTFTDAEALRALEVITTKRPALVLLEQRFASTPRGAALINRIKADPSLGETQIKVVAEEGGVREPGAVAAPVAAAAAAAARPAAGPTPEAAAPARSAHAPHAAAELDYRGTRRVTRFRIGGEQDIVVDGNKCTLLDLSTQGAQLVTVTILRPNQRVRVSLADDSGTIRCSATVVWASFEIPKGASPRYRAGLEFIKADAGALDGYIRRHQHAGHPHA